MPEEMNYMMTIKTVSLRDMLANIRTLQSNKTGSFEIVVPAVTVLEMLAILDKLALLVSFTDTMEIVCLELLKETLDATYMEAFNRLARKDQKTGQFSIPNTTPITLPSSILDTIGWLGEKIVTAEARDNRIEL